MYVRFDCDFVSVDFILCYPKTLWCAIYISSSSACGRGRGRIYNMLSIDKVLYLCWILFIHYRLNRWHPLLYQLELIADICLWRRDTPTMHYAAHLVSITFSHIPRMCNDYVYVTTHRKFYSRQNINKFLRYSHQSTLCPSPFHGISSLFFTIHWRMECQTSATLLTMCAKDIYMWLRRTTQSVRIEWMNSIDKFIMNSEKYCFCLFLSHTNWISFEKLNSRFALKPPFFLARIVAPFEETHTCSSVLRHTRCMNIIPTPFVRVRYIQQFARVFLNWTIPKMNYNSI